MLPLAELKVSVLAALAALLLDPELVCDADVGVEALPRIPRLVLLAPAGSGMGLLRCGGRISDSIVAGTLFQPVVRETQGNTAAKRASAVNTA